MFKLEVYKIISSIPNSAWNIRPSEKVSQQNASNHISIFYFSLDEADLSCKPCSSKIKITNNKNEKLSEVGAEINYLSSLPAKTNK